MSSNILLQCLLGIQGNGFAMIAADQTNTQSIIVMKNDAEKIHQVSDKLIIGVNGDSGDTAQFTQFIAKNIQLYKMRNGYQLDTSAAVHFARRNLAEGLRSGTPYLVNMLIGGYDEKEGGQLYYMDYLSSCLRVPFAAHGFGGMLSMGILDQHYKPGLTEQEAYEVVKLCIKEVQQRLFVSLPNFQVSIVTQTGVRKMPTISPASFMAQ